MTGDLFTITPKPQPDAVQREPEHIERAAAVTAYSLPVDDRCSVGFGRRENGCRGYGGGDFFHGKWWCEFHAPPGFSDFKKRA